jgi:hypothetical protein
MMKKYLVNLLIISIFGIASTTQQCCIYPGDLNTITSNKLVSAPPTDKCSYPYIWVSCETGCLMLKCSGQFRIFTYTNYAGMCGQNISLKAAEKAVNDYYEGIEILCEYTSGITSSPPSSSSASSPPSSSGVFVLITLAFLIIESLVASKI